MDDSVITFLRLDRQTPRSLGGHVSSEHSWQPSLSEPVAGLRLRGAAMVTTDPFLRSCYFFELVYARFCSGWLVNELRIQWCLTRHVRRGGDKQRLPLVAGPSPRTVPGLKGLSLQAGDHDARHLRRGHVWRLAAALPALGGGAAPGGRGVAGVPEEDRRLRGRAGGSRPGGPRPGLPGSLYAAPRPPEPGVRRPAGSSAPTLSIPNRPDGECRCRRSRRAGDIRGGGGQGSRAPVLGGA